MRVIIAGSRTIADYALLVQTMEEASLEGIVPTIVLSGACPTGVDALGERWAKERNIRVERFGADWRKFGRSAGPRRNSEMVERAEALVALWDGASRGTADVVGKMKALRRKVYVKEVR
jgi:SLOG family YspA-like protein